MSTILKIESLTKSYKRDFWAKSFFALKDLSFEVPTGEITGFLGANGAGKTTTIKIIFDFIRANNGTVSFPKFGADKKAQILKRIGYLPERPYYYPHLTGLEFLYYLGSLNDLKKDELESKSRYWAKRLGVWHALDRKLQHYSKGMLQRIGFASALLHDPEFLILDEPMSGLDPVGRGEFKEIMQELNRLGKTIFFSSHIVADVEEICRSIIFLDKGELAYQGKVQDLISKNIDEEIIVEFIGQKISDDLILEVGESRFLGSIPKEKKKAVLDEIRRTGGELIRLTPKRPTLEQIIYKLGR